MSGGVVAISDKNALSYSSFGAETTMDPSFRGQSVLWGDRYAQLDRCESYYACAQHDLKTWDFDGRPWNPRSVQPLIGAERSGIYIPLNMRRPSSTYRIGRIIVNAFTSMIFGEQKFPAVKVLGDMESEDFARTVAQEGRLPIKVAQARTLGGAMGTVGMSWCYVKGKPRFEVHNAKNLYVHSWEDRIALIPRHVTEVSQFYKVQWNGKEFARVYYWARRDWTSDADIMFRDVPVVQGQEPQWIQDEERSVLHEDGRIHFEWIQNLPSEAVDGFSDYEGLFENMDAIDVLMSIVYRGAALNLDPTLKIKMDPEMIGTMGIRKGSDQAIIVGESGDAEYLELGGSSLEVGLKIIEMKRKALLEAAQCIIPDPNDIAAQGTSSVALKMMYAPMIAKCDGIREQYGTAIERLLEIPLVVAQKMSSKRVIIMNDAGEKEEAVYAVKLPMRMESKMVPELDPVTGKTINKEVTTPVQRTPGKGDDVVLQWPPYFAPTPDDQSKAATTLQIATGGKAFFSTKTATEIAAAAFGVDPSEEVKRVEGQSSTEAAAQGTMFPPMGGVPGEHPEDDKGAATDDEQASPVKDAPDEGLPPEGE